MGDFHLQPPSWKMWAIEGLWVACVTFLGSLSHFLINFVAVLWMDPMPLSEIGSTVRRNLDDGTT